MSSESKKNLPASIHQRLRNLSKSSGRPFQELFQFYAIERLLYRLSVSSHRDKFVLKGALMFWVWQAPKMRPTMDIDLLGRMDNDFEAVRTVFEDTLRVEVEPDGLRFDEESIRVGSITEDAEYEGVRVQMKVYLAKSVVSIQIDIGFGDVVVPAPRMIEFPTLLDFPTPRLRGYPKETKVAEKFEAMVRHGQINSRMKDFFDIWLMSRTYDFDGKILAKAISGTFRNREQNINPEPVAFSKEFMENDDKQMQWKAFRVRTRVEDAPERFSDLVPILVGFLQPVATALANGEAFTAHWKAPGPWTNE